MQYVRDIRQHVPFYKSDYPQEDRRVFWHEQRKQCENCCVSGIPIVAGQYFMFVLDNDEVSDDSIQFLGASQNATIESCCLDDSSCETLTPVDVQGQVFTERKFCVQDGQAHEISYIRIKLPNSMQTGTRYLKITINTDQSLANQRQFYSQPVEIFEDEKCLYKLNINDSCQIGGVRWVDVWQGWSTIDGYEVYLPEVSSPCFVNEVTNQEFNESANGDRKLVFESREWRYEFDTGFIPEHFAEFIAEMTHTDSNKMTFADDQQRHTEDISQALVTIDPDDDGCYVQLNATFEINKYNSGKCEINEICECPQDKAIEVISYTVNQDDAEIDVEIGDCYIVPHLGPAPNNPDWSSHDNEIACWNGTGWDYETQTKGTLAHLTDSNDYFIYTGTTVLINIWIEAFLYIESVTYNGPGTCSYNVVSVLACGMFAKLQVSVSGSGTWTDSTNYLSWETWIAGVGHSTGFPNSYDLRLVPLNIGCNTPNSSEFGYVQTDSCV